MESTQQSRHRQHVVLYHRLVRGWALTEFQSLRALPVAMLTAARTYGMRSHWWTTDATEIGEFIGASRTSVLDALDELKRRKVVYLPDGTSRGFRIRLNSQPETWQKYKTRSYHGNELVFDVARSWDYRSVRKSNALRHLCHGSTKRKKNGVFTDRFELIRRGTLESLAKTPCKPTALLRFYWLVYYATTCQGLDEYPIGVDAFSEAFSVSKSTTYRVFRKAVKLGLVTQNRGTFSANPNYAYIKRIPESEQVSSDYSDGRSPTIVSGVSRIVSSEQIAKYPDRKRSSTIMIPVPDPEMITFRESVSRIVNICQGSTAKPTNGSSSSGRSEPPNTTRHRNAGNDPNLCHDLSILSPFEHYDPKRSHTAVIERSHGPLAYTHPTHHPPNKAVLATLGHFGEVNARAQQSHHAPETDPRSRVIRPPTAGNEGVGRASPVPSSEAVIVANMSAIATGRAHDYRDLVRAEVNAALHTDRQERALARRLLQEHKTTAT